MMKCHMKRMWVQYMSYWMNAQGLEQQDGESPFNTASEGNVSYSLLQYPILEAASSLGSVHLRLKVYRT